LPPWLGLPARSLHPVQWLWGRYPLPSQRGHPSPHSWWYQDAYGAWTAYNAGLWYEDYHYGGWWWLGYDGWWWTDGYY